MASETGSGKADRGGTVGWLGAGRMGLAMAGRLIDAGIGLSVYNRTREKAEPLAQRGATLADSVAALRAHDIVFTIVSDSDAYLDVTLGEGGLLAGDGPRPSLIVDCSTISTDASKRVREGAAEHGVAVLDAPVSGNPDVVEAGRLAVVASGPRDAYQRAEPYLQAIAKSVTYVGEGEVARTVKICHNVLLAAIAQSLAEITVLADKSGVARHALLDFINHSVVGSMFTHYKTPAMVKLDFTPTFTAKLLRKDVDLGLAAAHALDMPLPLAAQVREITQSLVGIGYGEKDCAALLELQARASGLVLEPEDAEVDTGL